MSRSTSSRAFSPESGRSILAGRTNAGSPLFGNLLELDTIAAVIIGGASFLGGRGHLGHALVGALMIGVIRNALNLLNVDIFFQLIVIGMVIVIAVEGDVLRNYLEERFRVAQGVRVGHESRTQRPRRLRRSADPRPRGSRRHQAVRAGSGADRVSLEVNRGEVLALLGDNGAGKSTIIKCISGVHQLDAGRIDPRRRTRRDRQRPRMPASAGIETVYQDLALFDNLDASPNFYAGRELSCPSWLPRGLRFMQRREMDEATRMLLDRLKVSCPAHDASSA